MRLRWARWRWAALAGGRGGRRAAMYLAIAGAGALLSGCGSQYVVLHPAGPVAAKELHLMILASVAMAVVIAFVFVLLAIAAVRFRDREGRRAPYTPNFRENKVLEVLWFVIPAIILTIVGIPTVQDTYALASLPKSPQTVVVDVTSLDWKWLFQYPGQHLATVNYLVIPTGRPVLFELTANSPMNAFWVPRLGGMEFAMPGEVLPLWLQADKPGVYWGHSANFSGLEFEKMFFTVRAVSPAAFQQWADAVQRNSPPMTAADYHRLLSLDTTGDVTYSSYPSGTFPTVTYGFSLTGGQYVITGRKVQTMHMSGDSGPSMPMGGSAQN